MSKIFICAAIPDEQAIKEDSAVAVATAIEAGDERRARAKFHWQFLEQFPAAQDCAYKFIVCEDKPGIPRPALDSGIPNICRKTAGMRSQLPLYRSNQNPIR